MKPGRRDHLFLADEEDALSAAEREELAALLEGDASARRAFVTHHLIGAQLGHLLPGEPPAPSLRRRRLTRSAGAAVVVMAAALVVVTWLRGHGSDPIASAARRELATLRRLPAPVLSALRGDPPDARGMLGANQRGFRCSGDQRGAVDSLVVALATDDRALLTESAGAIAATFAHQTPLGDFGDPPRCAAYWQHEISHALLLLRGSAPAALAPATIADWTSRAARTARWLTTPGPLAALRADNRSAGRILCYAGAFAATGALLGDDQLKALGTQFTGAALAMQRPDGAFENFGGLDTGFQATALLRLARLSFYPGAPPQAGEALRKAGAWLLAQVGPDGVLETAGNTRTGLCAAPRGRCMRVSYGQVAWSVAYYAALFEPRAFAALSRIQAAQRAAGPEQSLTLDDP